MASNDNIHHKLITGTQFHTFEALDKFIEEYAKQSRQVFVKRSSQRLDPIKWKGVNTDLVYYEIIYKCKFGGTYISESSGARKKRTFRRQCPAYIRVALSRNKTGLEIKKFCEDHQNHVGPEECVEYIPENRKLKEQKEKVLKLLELGCSKKVIQDKLAEEENKVISRKDLDNLARQLRKDDDDTLTASVELLQKTYGADVCIIHTNYEFKGLYFSTETMRRDIAMYPEIVFVDGTYKLFTRNFTLMLLVVEDGSTQTKIVGVGILENEERSTLEWFFECFKTHNAESTKRINCFMSDKDLTERSVIKKNFPGVPMYICLFHTLKTFSREITTNKMDISPKERVASLEYLDQLAKSSSDSAYDRIYNEFCQNAPQSVLEYFDKNWNPIRSEWTVCNMKHVTLGNTTNNRLESLNGKIKQVIDRKSTMVRFVKKFFKFLDCRNHQEAHKRAQEILKLDVVPFGPNSDESKYKTELTSYAFAFVLKEMKKSHAITFTKQDEKSMTCSIAYLDSVIQTGCLSCTCPTKIAMLLPCRHIFAVRRLYRVSAFDKALCPERWTKKYSTFDDCRLNNGDTRHKNTVHSSAVVTHVAPQKPRTAIKKKKILELTLNNLLHTAKVSPESTFDYRVSVLKQIQEMWDQGFEVYVTKAGASPVNSPIKNADQLVKGINTDENKTLTEHDMMDLKIDSDVLSTIQTEIANLSLQTENRPEELDDSSAIVNRSQSVIQSTPVSESEISGNVLDRFKLPPAIKLVGRPKGALSTTLGIPKRKSKLLPFREKNIETQRNEMFGWVFAAEVIPNILNHEYKVTSEDIIKLEFETISDAIVDEAVNFNIVKPYFEVAAFAELKEKIEAKRSAGLFTCDICKQIADIDCVFCDSCLKWSHFKCQLIKRAPRSELWFCVKCRNIR